MSTEQEIWEEKQVVIAARQVDHAMSLKMRNILMKMAVAAYADLDTFIDNGDSAPTYVDPDITYSIEHGGIRVVEGDRRFTIKFGVEMR